MKNQLHVPDRGFMGSVLTKVWRWKRLHDHPGFCFQLLKCNYLKKVSLVPYLNIIVIEVADSCLTASGHGSTLVFKPVGAGKTIR